MKAHCPCWKLKCGFLACCRCGLVHTRTGGRWWRAACPGRED